MYNLLLFAAFIEIITSLCDEKTRTRRPWYSLNDEEKSLYIEGFQAIRANGKLDVITARHAIPDNTMFHDSSFFTYYHNYLVWEIESAIRDLGDKFSCFAMPYYDWTYDSGLEDDPPIFHTGLGGDGDGDNNFCVYGDVNEWALCDSEHDNNNADEKCFWSPFDKMCAVDETYPNCCLKRKKSNTRTLTSAVEIGDIIKQLDGWTDYQMAIDYYHNYVHLLVASAHSAHMRDGWATDDPIFMILHSFVEYIRLMWLDCHNYDQVPVDEIDDDPNIYQIYCDDIVDEGCHTLWHLGLDDPFLLPYIEDADWTRAHRHEITVRHLYDPAQWDYKYELGPFYENAQISRWCKNVDDDDYDTAEYKLNGKWWTSNMIEEDSSRKSPVHKYSASVFETLESIGMTTADNINDAYHVASFLSCDYVRTNSKNSCFHSIKDLEYEKCPDLTHEQLADLTLDELLNYQGVSTNECLKQIRIDSWPSAQEHFKIKLLLCSGQLDYECMKTENEVEAIYEKFGLNKEMFLDQVNSKFIEHEVNINNNFAPNGLLYNAFILIIIIGPIISVLVYKICASIIKSKKLNKRYSSEYGSV